MADGLQIAKGHGTENDFVLVADPHGQQDLGPGLVRALCDRRAGIGGDGLIRVVRCDALPEGVEQAGEADWFMDYRNADGSLAQMCGNGIRVFAAYLLDQGLAGPDPDGGFTVGTRSGPVRVRPDGELLAATLGAWSVVGGPAATAAGGDVEVGIPGDLGTAGSTGLLPGLSVRTGNPHVVVALGDGLLHEQVVDPCLLVLGLRDPGLDAVRVSDERVDALRDSEPQPLCRTAVVLGAALAVVRRGPAARNLTVERRDPVAAIVADGLAQAVALTLAIPHHSFEALDTLIEPH